MPLCEPWVDAADVDCAEVDDLDLLERAATVASNLLFALSGRQYSGLCTDVVRPCRWADGAWAPYGTWGAWGRVPACGCLCPGPVSCGTSHDALPLPNTPVVSVTEVLVDGVALDEDWVIVDDRWAVRRSPERWPTSQYLDRLADEEGTWQVTYTYGTAVPADAVEAARVLACELAKGWSTGGACRLPDGVTSVIAENVSYDLGPTATAGLVDSVSTLTEVRLFLRAHNPHGLARRGRFINPRDHRGRRHRRIRPGSSTPLITVWSGGDSEGTGSGQLDGGDSDGTGGDTIDGGDA